MGDARGGASPPVDDALPPVVRIDAVPWDDPVAVGLRREQLAELAALYGDFGDLPPDLPADQVLASLLLTVDGTPAACAGLRDAAVHGERFAGRVGEIKRMFVRPEFRGRGYGRLLLARLEAVAADAGLARLVLETGVLQDSAVRLYRAAGYRRTRPFGPFADDPRTVYYARWLAPDAATRLLVLNGTVGAGKTTVAEAAADVLREAGVPYAWIDVDALRRVHPTADDDPFGQEVALDHLEAMAGVLARRGYRHVVLAEVIEHPADRERYEMAFDGAELVVVRLVASEATRLDRLRRREPDPWREWHLARTVELAAILETAGVDDAVVDNEGDRTPRQVAAEVLAVAGWR